MVFELGILAVLRFDTSASACTGSILGSNTTLLWILLVLQIFLGSILLWNSTVVEVFLGLDALENCLYLLEVFTDPVLLVL